MRNDLTSELKEIEFDFENEVKTLDGIIFNNPSAIFFDVVLIKYENNNTKKFTLTKWNATKNLRNLMRMFYKQNIFYKNLIKKENVYFAVTEKTRLLNFVWFDDVKLKNINEKQLPFLTLIETSPDNFQAWIKLDKLYTKTEIQQIKNYLITKLKADKAASAYIQPMRLPGFFSHKHQEQFYVKLFKTSDKALNGRKLLNKINNLTINTKTETKQEDFKNKINISQNKNKNKNKNDGWKKYSYYKKELMLDNTEFNPSDERDVIVAYAEQKFEKVDKNIIDIMFVYQLLIRDYSESDIFLYLSNSREDLDEKHKASDYFERTYLKALLFYKLFYEEGKKLYENRELNQYIKLQKGKGIWKEDKKVVENLRILINNFKK